MKRILWLVVIFLFIVGAVWAQFYEKLSREQRRELAEAYYLVSRQYAQAGEKAKAGEFERMAYNIDPGIDPSRIQLKEQPSAASLILEGKAVLAAAPRERAEAVQQLIKSRFLRLVSSLLTKDTESMLELMDGSVYFTKLDLELKQADMRRELNGFFAQINLAGGLAPSQVFDLNSLEVATIAAASPQWGETYAVRVRARMDFSAQVAFWEDNQQYLFHRSGMRWLLFSVGQKLPAAAWVPKQAPEPAARKAAAPQAGPGGEIREALLASLNYFLQKDVERAAQFFAEQILILRLNTSLTRQEMASTFEGYFEDSDFSGIKPSDLLDTNSISVEESDRFAAAIKGPVYLLSVKTKLDLSDKIPFWTRFQEYYFSSEEGSWKIFAIF